MSCWVLVGTVLGATACSSPPEQDARFTLPPQQAENPSKITPLPPIENQQKLNVYQQPSNVQVASFVQSPQPVQQAKLTQHPEQLRQAKLPQQELPAILPSPSDQTEEPVEPAREPDIEQVGDSPELLPPDDPALTLPRVLDSVYQSYPLLQIALQQRTIAEGRVIEARGAFDLKLKGGGTTGPLGFYQTNRFGTGLEQALFRGGEVFAGYRIGRGNFQPWYGERETDDGGEFKAGFLIPLAQNRRIDARRAALFRAILGRNAVEPDILLQLIEIVQAASYAYWDWVAAGQNVRIEQALLNIALQRQEGLQKRVEQGDLSPIELTDNERLIASRRASLIDAQRKFRQSAIKLSLFVRSSEGEPQLPLDSWLPPDFPPIRPYDEQRLPVDVEAALAARPETQFLDFVRRQLEVDLTEARNLYLPEISVGAIAAKDVGPQASPKGDKRPFELEATLLMSLPLQRRKALGKLQAVEGKLLQVQAKSRFARDKIATDVQNAVAALQAAYRRIGQAEQSVKLNRQMEEAERKRFDAGDSNLLLVNLREKATADARKTLVGAKLEYFRAEADLRAAMGDVPLP